MPTRLNQPVLVLAIFFIIGGAASIAGQDKDWRPVTPDELGQKTSKVEPGADAEAIFWDVRIDDSSDESLSLRHYIRVKIFTERGREKFSKIDIPFRTGVTIKDLAARVIKPDGSIAEIKKEEIFEREIVKADGVRLRAKSFAVANIEAGVIVEYRYKEETRYGGATGMHLQFQRDIPAQSIAYYFKPYNGKQPNTQNHNLPGTKFVKDKGGYWLAARTDVPAQLDEPRMPPEDTVRAWMKVRGGKLIFASSIGLFSFDLKPPTDPSLYWVQFSSVYGGWVRLMKKGDSEISKTAAEITAGSVTPDDKLRRIYEFCQTQIANTTFDPKLTDEERNKLPVVRKIEDILERRSGTPYYIDTLFGALASATGFEARMVLTGDRSRMFFDPTMLDQTLLHQAAIAIKVDDTWRYFHPGGRFVPYGMMGWQEEGSWGLLIGEDRFDWQKTPYTDHTKSVTKRTGKFSLSDDGTLEGEARVELHGQLGLEYRLDTYDETPAKREEELIEKVKRQIPEAEVSAVSIDNVMDNSKPVVQAYRIRVPNYAQKTGRRLFVQPGFFTYRAAPLFTSAARKYDIYFRFPWSETDTVEIVWPAGFDLDNTDAPDSIADPQRVASLAIRMKVDRAVNLLRYERQFHMGGGGTVLFPAATYSALKGLFDAFGRSDAHTIALKQK